MLHHSYGASGELLEILEATDRANLIEEIGDFLFYLQGLLSSINIPCCSHYNMVDFLHGAKFKNMLAEHYKSNNPPTFVEHFERVFNAIKKHVFYEQELDKFEVVREAELVLVSLAMTFNVNLLDAIEANKAKLAVRYENFEYSDESAKLRKDKNAPIR